MTDTVKKWNTSARVRGSKGILFSFATLAEDVSSRFTFVGQHEALYQSGTVLAPIPIAGGTVLVVLSNVPVTIRLNGDNLQVAVIDKMLVLDCPFSTVELSVSSTVAPAKVHVISLTKET